MGLTVSLYHFFFICVFFFICGRNSMCLTNRDNFRSLLHTHSQEEADILIVLYSHEISRTDPFTEIYISSRDTDVLVAMIGY